jgi:hypothetical protein
MRFLLNLAVVGLVTKAAFLWMQEQSKNNPHATAVHRDPDQDTAIAWIRKGEQVLTPDEVRWSQELYGE